MMPHGSKNKPNSYWWKIGLVTFLIAAMTLPFIWSISLFTAKAVVLAAVYTAIAITIPFVAIAISKILAERVSLALKTSSYEKPTPTWRSTCATILQNMTDQLGSAPVVRGTVEQLDIIAQTLPNTVVSSIKQGITFIRQGIAAAANETGESSDELQPRRPS